MSEGETSALGPTPVGWRGARLGELADFVNGRAFKPSDWVDAGTPIVRIQNLNGSKEFNHYSGEIELRFVVHSGDLLFSWSGTRGTSFGPHRWRGPTGVLNQHIFNVRNIRGAEKDYLFHALKAITGIVEQRAHGGTGIVHITKGQLEGFKVPLPPLPEQRKIAAILSSVDDTIAKAEAVTEQLETVGETLLWNLLTRGMPGRHKEFRPSGIGAVPVEWRVARLGDLLREPIRNGFSAHAATTETGRWIAHVGAVTMSGFNPAAVKPVDAEDNRVAAARLAFDDLLVSRSNTRERVGLPGVYRGTPEWCAYPDLLMRIRPCNYVKVAFLEQWLLGKYARGYFQRSARGTSESMVKIDRAILEGCLVPVPAVAEQEEIVRFAELMRERLMKEREAAEAKRALKSALLDALLSGRIRVTTPAQEVA